MKRFLFLLMLSVFIASCGSKKGDENKLDQDKAAHDSEEVVTNGSKDTTEVKTDPDNGKVNYKKLCMACHGEDGNLGIAGAKKIPESSLSQKEREQIIRDGRKTMPSFSAQLTDAEITAVAAYTFELK